MLKKKRLGDILLNQGVITQKDLEKSLNKQQELKKEGNYKKLGEILKEENNIKDKEVLKALSKQFNLPIYNLEKLEKEIDEKVYSNIDKEIIFEQEIIPVKYEGNKIVVALNNPLNITGIEEFEIKYKKNTKQILISKTDLEEILKILEISESENLSNDDNTNELIEEIQKDIKKMGSNSKENYKLIEELTEDSAVVKLVNDIINKGVNNRASDIHIEPLDKKVIVRYRIDGILYKEKEFSKEILPYINSRIKTIANLDIAERRLPQDGRIKMDDVDLRVSSVNTVRGEKIVLRILDQNQGLNLDKLGFNEKNKEKVLEMVNKPKGLVLVTGATGSGKSTTLYSLLQKLDYSKENISTVEDPVEYQIEGFNQIQVKNKIGLNFAKVLRTLLRQDPDIIMVGEIRDKETAKISLKASETGHLVLSTLHTNTAIKTINRLFEMGLEKFLVISALEGIISQALVRTLCDSCKEEREINQKELKSLNGKNKDINIQKVYEPKGCEKCNGGFKGRTAIYEILTIDENLEKMVDEDLSINEIKEKLLKNGHKTLTVDGLEKVKKGITTIEEIKKVTGF